jgi:colanic acid/amylovoran biosynthesis glycosyltransferase
VKVLMITGGFPLGSETFVSDQVTGLLEAGCDLEVLALRPGDETAFDERSVALGVPGRLHRADLGRSLVSRLLRLPGRLLRVARRNPRAAWGLLSPRHPAWTLNGILAEAAAALPDGPWPRQYDMVHCVFGPSGIVASRLRRAGVLTGPISVSFYGYDLTREPRLRGRNLYREVFEDASWLLPNSTYLASRLHDLGAPPEKVQVHRLGIETRRFTFFDRADRPEDRPWIALAVGRLVEKKGFEDLVRALAAGDGRLANLVVEIAGDGPLRSRIESLAESLGVPDRVRVLGWLDREGVAAAMKRADLLVAPSVTAGDGDMEGLPLVIVEAMATGLPVVGTEHSGIPEAVRDGENGRIVPEHAPERLAEAISECAKKDRRLEFGRRSHAIAKADFEHSRLIADLLARWRSREPYGNAAGR